VRTDRGFDRFITFLDAVVAIAITLLVLPLTEMLAGAHVPAHAADVFTENGPSFAAFLISFAVIARLWLAHHRMVERVGAYDVAFVWINLGWVLTIVFLPFATQLTSVYPARDRLTLALSALFLAWAAFLVWRRPGLRRPGVTVEQAAPWPALLIAGALLFAAVVGTAFPQVNYYALLLLLVTARFERLLPDRDGSEPLDPEATEG
jgi:uncharacterized membrane protein